MQATKKKTTKSTFQEVATSISSEEELDYDSDDDPEWRQTPMFKRIKKLKEEANGQAPPPKMPTIEVPEKKTVSQIVSLILLTSYFDIDECSLIFT